MYEMKCKECGEELTQNAMECPSCGCQVNTVAPVGEVGKKTKSKRFNVMSIFSILLGVTIIVLGIVVMNKKTELTTYSTANYYVREAEFGADFYTYMYKASETIVDELDDINKGLAIVARSMNTMANEIYFPIGMLIIAIGIGVIAITFNHMIRPKI